MIPSTFGAVKSFYKNEIIFKVGQPGNHGFLIKSGEVTIFRMIDNEKKILNVLRPGEIFGEMSVIKQAPRSANAVASEYCELVVIDKQTLSRLLSESPKIIQSITQLLMNRLIHLTDMISQGANSETANSQKFVRICKLVHLVAKSAVIPADGSIIDYNEFCENAIDIICVSRAEIDQVIKKLSSLKLLTISGDLRQKSDSKITIPKPDEFLEAVGNATGSLPGKTPATENQGESPQ